MRLPRIRRFVVKVQLSIVTTERQRQILMYNRDRSVWWQGDLSESVAQRVGADLKQFWMAHLEGTKVYLDHRVKDRDW